MQIILTPEESELYFFNALCNGLSYMSGYGIRLYSNTKEYNQAKKSLQEKKPKEVICWEDVCMEILRQGGNLTMVDVEGEGDMTRSITLKEVHERVQKTPLDHLTDMIKETDDATTADVILQSVFYEDIIFG